VSHAAVVVILFLATGLASLLFVWESIALSKRMGIIDQPDPRRAGMALKPRGAGVALFVAFAFGLALSYSLDVLRFAQETERLLLLLAGAGFITCVTVYDDIVGMPPLPKLGLQIAASALVIFPRFQGEGHGIVIESFNSPFGGQIELALVPAVLFSLFWFVGMMNTINFVDGLDGLAGSVTLIACAILFVHTYCLEPQFTISLLAVILGATTAGFLVFNWHPSKVIMGDAGAYFLGFTLAGIAIVGGAKIATALLVLGLPILDVASVIVTRLLRRGSPAVADRVHLHYRLLDRGWTHTRVTLLVAAVSAAFGAAGLLLPNSGSKLIALIAIGVLVLGIVTLLTLQERNSAKTKANLGETGISALS
jgi:UDP-N-acetylmuramyl pentapeptide phosphotransferase/UDP-N-acetylglucosamine-1-phosphate transferase